MRSARATSAWGVATGPRVEVIVGWAKQGGEDDRKVARLPALTSSSPNTCDVPYQATIPSSGLGRIPTPGPEQVTFDWLRPPAPCAIRPIEKSPSSGPARPQPMLS